MKKDIYPAGRKRFLPYRYHDVLLFIKHGEILDGKFWESKIQEVKKADDIYIVENILKQRKLRAQTKYLFELRSYPDSMHNWVSEKKSLVLL